MSYTALIIKGESVSVTLNGLTTNVPADAPNFDVLCDLVRRQAPDEEIKSVLTPAAAITKVAQDAGFEIRIHGEAVGVFFNGEEVHSKLSELIVEHYLSGADFIPLRNFMTKAMSNRDSKEADILYDFVTKNKLPIHPDGDFLAFKATRADGYDKHTGTVKYAIGQYLHVENFDPSKYKQCGSGLHIGGRNYVDWYGHTGDAHWIVKVDPADTIFYRADAGEGKMRVKKLFVYAQISKPETLDSFLPFMVALSPEGDALEQVAKEAPISEESEGASAKVKKQTAVWKNEAEKKTVSEAKKSQSFVTKKSNSLTFTTKSGKTYSAKEVLKGIEAHGQRGYSAITGIARTTLQGWLDAIKSQTGKR